MKADHRHELKTNELADWLAHFPDWAKENRNNIIVVAVVVIVAVVVYFWVFYSRDVLAARKQVRLTSLVTQVSQQVNNVAQAAMQNEDQSYTLVPVADDLEEFARSASNNDMAALAWIERAETLRAELHYRLAEVSREEVAKQIGLAETSYQEALQRKPSPALAAMAQLGVGLCQEELGNFDKAAEKYRDVAENEAYKGTSARAAAAYRLKIMGDYKTPVVFKPAPPKPQPAQSSAPTVRLLPGDANAPMVIQVPNDVNVAPAAPGASQPEQAPPADTNAPPEG